MTDPNHDSQWKHDHFAPFLIHENPQFLIQKDTVKLKVVDKALYADDYFNYDQYPQTQDGQYLLVDQYYYMTNDNQFMLVYPNYLDLRLKNEVIFQIAQNHSYIIVNDEDYEYMDDFR